MMQKIKILILTVLTAINTIGQDTLLPPPEVLPDIILPSIYKDYFFDNKLQINDSTSLIVLIKDAQTQMARELGNRIYTDTAFIRKIKNRFYEEKEVINGILSEEVHFCGHDMYFYSLSKGNMTYLNRLNSNCGLSEVSCKDLSILFESGRIMRIDTLTSLPKKYKKSRDGLFTDNVIMSYFEDTQSWDICQSSRFPKIYYDGYFKLEVILDTSFTINQNIEKLLKQYSDDIQNMNWNVWSTDIEARKFNILNETTKFEVFVYLKRQSFKDFKTFDIQPIIPVINKNNRLLIFYND